MRAAAEQSILTSTRREARNAMHVRPVMAIDCVLGGWGAGGLGGGAREGCLVDAATIQLAVFANKYKCQ